MSELNGEGAEQIKSLKAQLRMLHDSHAWLYREKERLENALKDIASRAHANISHSESTPEPHHDN